MPFLLVLALTGCGSSSATSPTVPSAPPASTPQVTRVVELSGNLSFGDVPVGTTATAVLTIKNTGNATLTVTGFSASNSMNAVLLADWLTGTIPAGGSQQVQIQFTPAAAQTYSAIISVASDATSGTNTIPVSGTGTTPPTGSGPAAAYYVYGGTSSKQYLGFFACIFCTDYDTDSINNEYGKYGSAYSSTSMRNRYSDYGSPYSSSSACNEYASNPPKVFDVNGTYRGELTLNKYRPNAITNTDVVNWLTQSVCKG